MVQPKSGSGRDRSAPSTTAREADRPSVLPTQMVELSRDESLRLLASHRFGRLAVGTGTGAPLVRPVNYRFDESSQSVVFRTAPGSKFHALVHSAQAVFEIDGVDERSQTGWSVVVHGMTDEVSNWSDIRRLDALGLDCWAPGRKPRWFRIRAWTVSGRRIVLTPDAGSFQ